MERSHDVSDNRLLCALPAENRARMATQMTRVMLACGDVLQVAGQPIEAIHFPLDCLVSLLADCGEGKMLEVDLVGAEGVVGISACWGSTLSPVRAIVLKAGCAARIDVAGLQKECKCNPALQQALNRNASTLLARAIQLAACNRYHALEARFARSLLLMRERLQTDCFHATHETFSRALGVRRVGVTGAASALQQQKLISYSRGDITILDAEGLARVSCACQHIADRIAAGA